MCMGVPERRAGDIDPNMFLGTTKNGLQFFGEPYMTGRPEQTQASTDKLCLLSKYPTPRVYKEPGTTMLVENRNILP